MLTDTHCHLDFHQFDTDRLEIIDRAQLVKIERLLNPGIDIISSLKAIKLADKHELVYAAIGVHPNNAKSWTDETASQLIEMAQDDKVVAIGEIGLDYFHDTSPRDLQVRIFEEQLLVASKVNLPVVIHTRNKNHEDKKAIKDAMEILSIWVTNIPNENGKLKENPGVLHSFSSDENFAKLAAKYNFAIGITGPITYKKNEPMKTVVQNIDIEYILVETDAPFLTPHPLRGKRNEPAFVNYVVEKIAEIRKMSYDLVSDITTNNAKRIFNW